MTRKIVKRSTFFDEIETVNYMSCPLRYTGWLCTYDWCFLRAQQEPSVNFYRDTIKQTNCFILKKYTIHLIYITEFT